jgi:hypothetical protein
MSGETKRRAQAPPRLSSTLPYFLGANDPYKSLKTALREVMKVFRV